MLTRASHAIRARLRDQRGFTLMEVLVAMLTGLIVTGALFAILEVSLNQTSRVDDRVQANQLGRIAMTRIVDELHSTCLSPEFRPIQEKSSPSELRFINGYSKEASIAASEVTEHRIVWSKAAGTLTDYSYAPTGTWPEFKPSGSAATSHNVIASNIVETEEKGTKIPVFKYFSYATSSSSGSEAPVVTLKEITVVKELALKEAKEAASVQIAFTALPTDGSSALNRGVEMRNQVTLAMSAPSSETPIEASPCE